MSKIIYLKLVNFKRFPLRDLEIFEYHFKSKLLMIIGPNGAGKSSLLYELSALPSAKENFNKNGYKEIVISKDNSVYRLISDFTDGVKYHFIVDGLELNQSGNITTQRDLVQSHFMLTQGLHELLTGYENFTDMSLLARRRLFNSITHLNIDSLLFNYNKLKEDLKNNEYLLKTQIQLKHAEEQKLLDSGKLKTLSDKVMHVKNYIDILLDIRSNLSKYTNDTTSPSLDNINVLKDKLNTIVQRYYIFLTSYGITDISKYTTQYATNKNVIQYKLDTLYTQIEKKQEQLKILELSKQSNLQELTEAYVENSKTKNMLINTLSIFDLTVNETQNLKNTLYKLEATLPEIVRSIPTNTNSEYTKEKMQAYLVNKNNSLESLNTLITNVNAKQKELDHILSHKENKIECPNCKNRWSLIYSDEKVSTLSDEISKLEKYRYELQLHISSLDKRIETIMNYYTYYNQFMSLRSSTYELIKPVWEHIDKSNYIYNEPPSILTILKIASRDLSTLDDLVLLNEKLVKISSNIDALTNVESSDLNEVNNELVELTETVYELQMCKDDIDIHLSYLNVTDRVYKAIEAIQTSIQSNVSEIKDFNLTTTINDIILLFDDEIRVHKVSLIELENEINAHNNIQYALDKYNTVITDITENVKVLTILLNELSPKNGLIAKSVSSFLNIIINGINNIINSIWEYKMNIKVINIEDDVLNYKFKVSVEDKIEIDDINKVSSGMREIINLSFRLVLYKLLGLEGFPFYADEFGVKLDSVHRSKISSLIFSLIGDSWYSQIFLITHMDMSYSLFKDVEVLDLSQ